MSTPTIPDMNPDININRQDSVNIIMASIGMEELALAHILNAEGEKLQYILGTLEGSDPGEVTICDIMAVNDSINKTLREVIKTEMLLQFKLEDAIELDNFNITNTAEPGLITINGEKIWFDNDETAEDRPTQITVNLLQNGVPFRSEQVDSPDFPNDTVPFSFIDVPQFDEEGNLFVYTVDENDLDRYTKSIDGFVITNKHIIIP